MKNKKFIPLNSKLFFFFFVNEWQKPSKEKFIIIGQILHSGGILIEKTRVQKSTDALKHQ